MASMTGTGGTGTRRAVLTWRGGLAELAILLALIVIFSFLNPASFPTLTNLDTILNNAAIPIVVGVGASAVVLTGRIDLLAIDDADVTVVDFKTGEESADHDEQVPALGLQEGQAVNLEFDLLGKYVQRHFALTGVAGAPDDALASGPGSSLPDRRTRRSGTGSRIRGGSSPGRRSQSRTEMWR